MLVSIWCRAFVLLMLLFSLTSCELITLKQEAKYFNSGETQTTNFVSGGEGQFINIANLYEQYSPRQSDFDDLFLPGLSDAVYRQYSWLLEQKLKLHRHTKRFYEVSLLGKERITQRKYELRKEWVWGKHQKQKLLEYYQLFLQPNAMYEHRVSYRITPFNDQGVTEESARKTIATETQYLLFFYKRRGDGKVYLIDPDIFIQSIL